MSGEQGPSTRNVWASAAGVARRELAAFEAGRREASEQQLRVWRRTLDLAREWGLR